MDHVDAVASQVRQRIENFRDLPQSIGESNTKASLIEPLLQALDWDVHDPTEVHREFRFFGDPFIETFEHSATANKMNAVGEKR